MGSKLSSAAIAITPDEYVSVGPSFDLERQALNAASKTIPISQNCLFIIFLL
jgi:hypothetical protein